MPRATTPVSWRADILLIQARFQEGGRTMWIVWDGCNTLDIHGGCVVAYKGVGRERVMKQIELVFLGLTLVRTFEHDMGARKLQVRCCLRDTATRRSCLKNEGDSETIVGGRFTKTHVHAAQCPTVITIGARGNWDWRTLYPIFDVLRMLCIRKSDTQDFHLEAELCRNMTPGETRPVVHLTKSDLPVNMWWWWQGRSLKTYQNSSSSLGLFKTLKLKLNVLPFEGDVLSRVDGVMSASIIYAFRRPNVCCWLTRYHELVGNQL